MRFNVITTDAQLAQTEAFQNRVATLATTRRNEALLLAAAEYIAANQGDDEAMEYLTRQLA